MTKHAVILALAVLAAPHHVAAQNFTDSFIQAYETGLRHRTMRTAIAVMQIELANKDEYYKQQLELMRQQQQVLRLQAEQLEAAKATAAKPTDAQIEAAVRSTVAEFTMRRPDWRQYETVMVAYAQKMPPGTLPEVDYLDALYFLAQRDAEDQIRRAAAEQRVNEILEELTRLHPDWRKYEQRMQALLAAAPVPANTSDVEYLSLLYAAAKGQ